MEDFENRLSTMKQTFVKNSFLTGHSIQEMVKLLGSDKNDIDSEL